MSRLIVISLITFHAIRCRHFASPPTPLPCCRAIISLPLIFADAIFTPLPAPFRYAMRAMLLLADTLDAAFAGVIDAYCHFQRY